MNEDPRTIEANGFKDDLRGAGQVGVFNLKLNRCFVSHVHQQSGIGHGRWFEFKLRLEPFHVPSG